MKYIDGPNGQSSGTPYPEYLGNFTENIPVESAWNLQLPSGPCHNLSEALVQFCQKLLLKLLWNFRGILPEAYPFTRRQGTQSQSVFLTFDQTLFRISKHPNCWFFKTTYSCKITT